MMPFFAALAFLTVLPVPSRWTGDGETLGRSLPWFPAVGLTAGIVLGGIAWCLAGWLPPLAAAAALTLAMAAVHGALHLDGLADTADGFMSHRPRERVLEIMRDSRVGAMGVLAIVADLLLLTSLLAGIAAGGPLLFWRTTCLLAVAGRCAMLMVLAVVPYARPEGLGTIFYAHRRRWHAAWAAAMALIAGGLLLGSAGVAAAVAALGASLCLAGWSIRKIGGATGDTLGATHEIAVLAAAFVIAVWSHGLG